MKRLSKFAISTIPSGEGMKYVRTELGLTQTELGKALGVSLSTINKWENGKLQPRRKHRERLEQFCRDNNIQYEQFQTGTLASRMVDNYDHYTSGHQARVCLLAAETSKKLTGINKADLRVGAVHHDVGKMVCSRDLLNKPGFYNPAEKEQVKEYAPVGETLVSMLMLAHPRSAVIVGQHHERVDGKGYGGLQEKDILPEAKLLAICDVFDAVTTLRPHTEKKASVEKAIEILRSDEGLDQRLVEKFARAIRKPGFLDALEDDTHRYSYDNRDAFCTRPGQKNK